MTLCHIEKSGCSPAEREQKLIELLNRKVIKVHNVQHELIPPRTPWHNGKVERSHRNDRRYFYNWEKFASVKDLNRKLKDHLHWSNRKPIRTLGGKSPLDLLREILSNA